MPKHDQIVKIKSQLMGSEYEVDTGLSLMRVASECPKFFDTPHGKRETYSMHQGFMIVRNTVTFTGCRPQRRTVIYMVTRDMFEGRPKYDTLCVQTGSSMSIRQAERFIDKVIKERSYQFE